MLSFICIISLFLGQCLASPSADQYIDTVLNTALQNVIQKEKLDPTHLADFTFDYKDKTFFGTVNGKAEYTEGSLSGLSKIKRFSHCDGPKNISSITIINCTLVFENLEASHTGKVKYGVLPKVTIYAKGSMQPTNVTVEIYKSSSDRNPKAKNLSFGVIGSMHTSFTGLGPVLNKHMKVLEENYKRVVPAEIKSAIANRFQYALNMAVASVPMPLR